MPAYEGTRRLIGSADDFPVYRASAIEVAQHFQRLAIVECVAPTSLKAKHLEIVADPRFGDGELAADFSADGDCRFQFTVTTHTPLHSTKLPLRVWLKAMWLMLQSDKGLSSVRLAEILGVSQPTAWRMGHALRLMVARENKLDGTVEIDHFHLGGSPQKAAG
jgi:hypothetical protein